MKSTKEQKVCVIGAGVAGCAAAGALKDHGIDFVVYDKNERPGGLWVDNYPGVRVQSTFELYEYPCKKFPPHIRNRKDPPAPVGSEVCTYLEEYMEEKDMTTHFRFGKVIRGVLCEAEDDWIIEFSDFSTERFTFVIVCNGLVSAKPNMMHIPGQESFLEKGGMILHSSQRRTDEIFHGKRVLVIGNGKSAVDAASAAADVSKKLEGPPPLLLARRQTWYVPRYLMGFLPYKWVFHTRLGSALLPRYFETSAPILVALHTLFAPLKWLVWRLMEALLLLQYKLPYHLWPRWGTLERAALETSVLITDECHLQRIRNDEIDMRINTVERLIPGKAKLMNGDVEDADVVVLATGWKLSFDTFLSNADIFAGFEYDKDVLDFCDDGLWLYRNMLPPGFQGMAFVGSNTLTFMNIYTSYIQSYWLAQLLAGKREWPNQEHMKETIQREKTFKRKYYKECGMRGASIEAYMQHYHDVLFREMNARQPFHILIRPIANLLVPVVPSVMKGCLEPQRSPKTSKAKKQQQQNQVPQKEQKKTKNHPKWACGWTDGWNFALWIVSYHCFPLSFFFGMVATHHVQCVIFPVSLH